MVINKRIIIFKHDLDIKPSPEIEGANIVTLHYDSKTACLMAISGQSTHQLGETVYVILSPRITLIVEEDPLLQDLDVLTYCCHEDWDLSEINSFIEGNSEVNNSMVKS